jgi:hypothetical protein
MGDNLDSECSFTIEDIRKDDPRLKTLLEMLEEDEQPFLYATIQLISGSDKLEIEDVNLWEQSHLTDEDFNRLRSLGLKGKLRVAGWGTSGQCPYKARTLVVARYQIREAVNLPLPDGCAVVYYQEGDEWRRFPVEVPVLKKRFCLTVDGVIRI